MAGSDTRYAEIYLIRIQHLMFSVLPSITIVYILAVKDNFLVVISLDFRVKTDG